MQYEIRIRIRLVKELFRKRGNLLRNGKKTRLKQRVLVIYVISIFLYRSVWWTICPRMKKKVLKAAEK